MCSEASSKMDSMDCYRKQKTIWRLLAFLRDDQYFQDANDNSLTIRERRFSLLRMTFCDLFALTQLINLSRVNCAVEQGQKERRGGLQPLKAK